MVYTSGFFPPENGLDMVPFSRDAVPHVRSPTSPAAASEATPASPPRRSETWRRIRDGQTVEGMVILNYAIAVYHINKAYINPMEGNIPRKYGLRWWFPES